MEGRKDKGCWRNPKALTVVTSMCACASFSFLCVAVATDYWLYAEDRIEFANQTGYYIKTYSGLWKKCTIDVKRSPEKNCSYIPYFKHAEREDLRPSESVLLSLPRASIFPMASLVILLVGEIACFVGQCSHRNVLTFISGILFVVGGLCTLVGVIIYISAVTEEASSSKPKSSMDEPKFRYSYGPSFAMTICSFIGCQLTGVLAVYLCIVQFRHVIFKKQQLHLLEKQQRLSSANECRQRLSVRTSSTEDDTDVITPGFQDFTSNELPPLFVPHEPLKSSTIEFNTPQLRHKTPTTSIEPSVFSSGASVPSLASPCPLIDYHSHDPMSREHFPYHYYNPHYFNPRHEQLLDRISPNHDKKKRLSKSCMGLVTRERQRSETNDVYNEDNSDEGPAINPPRSGLLNVDAQVHASHFNPTKPVHHRPRRRSSHRSKHRGQESQQIPLIPQQVNPQAPQPFSEVAEHEPGLKRTTVV